MSLPIGYALFSGGHDSLCSTHVAMSAGLASRVVTVNTGIGIEETRQFVRDTCAHHGWPLTELRPPVSFREIVERGGLPGPAQHFTRPGKWVGIYTQLKERCFAEFARQAKPKRGYPHLYITGVRKEESDRREIHVEEFRHAPKLGWSWYAPNFDWTKADVNRYIEERGLQRNPVVDLLHMSGECLCGCFAHPGERDELRMWYPDVEAEISDLESLAAEAGHAACKWGERPPKEHPGQLVAFDPDAMACMSCSPGMAVAA